MYSELLVPIECVDFVKGHQATINHFNQAFISVTDLFNVHKQNGAWIWNATESFKKTYPYMLPISSDHSSWMKARDQAIEIIEDFCSIVLDKRMREVHMNEYGLKSCLHPKVTTVASTYRKKLHKPMWEIAAKTHMSDYFVETFPTRKQTLPFLYQYVKNNLSELFTYYLKMNDNDLDEYYNDRDLLLSQKKAYIRHWWLMFVRDDVDIASLVL